MTRHLAFVSAAALLAAVVQGQCFTAATGTNAGLVQWNAFDSYSSTYAVDDEGLTSPPIALTAFPSFPMAGAIGTLNQMWIGSNGELYLTDSSLGLTEPVDGAGFGASYLDAFRGTVPGASARVVAMGMDCEASGVAGSAWSVKVDQTVPGQVRVTWTDLARYFTPTDRFSFSCTLFSNGAIELSYGQNIPDDFQFAGVSIGNMVGSPNSPSLDLQSSDSGTEGLLYEDFGIAGWDLSNSTILILPNGIGGYTSTQTCGPAFHAAYGTGCYGPQLTDSVHEIFGLPSQASAALQGNAMLLLPAGNGYSVNWLPGGAAAYLPPSGGAANVYATPQDDGAIVVTPSIPLTTPGGSTATLNVMSNGVITLGSSDVQFSYYGANSVDFALSDATAVYTWHDFNEAETGSGRIVSEELGGVLYVTWNNVESYADPDSTVNRSTVQFQFDLASGVITVLWVAISPDDSESTWDEGLPYLVGLGGPDLEAAGPISFATGLPVVTSPNLAMSPLALSASPAPVFTIGGSSVPITYTVDNIVDVVPPFGIGISLLMFSVAPFPGLDLGFLGMPGCNLNIASLDVILTMPGGTAPLDSITLSVPQPLSPGLSFYSQAMSLFAPNSLPNGQNAFGATMSNGLQSSFNTF